MSNVRCWITLGLLGGFAVPAMAQSFRVQCPSSTITHPAANNDSEPPYLGPTVLTTGAHGYLAPSTNVNGAIKCQQISGGDGYATMGDGTQTYIFSFGPLSGLAKIATGQPGTDSPSEFNTLYDPTAAGNTPFQPGDPATTIAVTPQGGFMPPLTQSQLTSLGGFYNGAVGLAKDVAALVSIYDISESGHTVTVITNSPLGVNTGDSVTARGAKLAERPNSPPVSRPYLERHVVFVLPFAGNVGDVGAAEDKLHEAVYRICTVLQFSQFGAAPCP